MYLLIGYQGVRGLRFPHTRGGVPHSRQKGNGKTWFSPHTWGCTVSAVPSLPTLNVFRTHVGVYLQGAKANFPEGSFPHTRGGVPTGDAITGATITFSPHTWGCTYQCAQPKFQMMVFPTHVGVYLVFRKIVVIGVVFPTHVGVYLNARHFFTHRTRFPHTRGGVPSSTIAIASKTEFSPHTWGCTELWMSPRQTLQVFPTHVGVYLWYMPAVLQVSRFPHTRGGVPWWASRKRKQELFSPHTWGCTGCGQRGFWCGRVFPTHVGVYLEEQPVGHLRGCFPHTRGGVPP